MSEIHEAWSAVAELLGDFAHKRLSPCVSLALGALALTAGHGDDPSIGAARRRAGERGDSTLERAFEVAAGV